MRPLKKFRNVSMGKYARLTRRTNKMQNLIKAVRDHALANWGKDGWDFLVECWDDEDIADAIGNAKTPKAAIAACKRKVKWLDEYRSEIRATADW